MSETCSSTWSTPSGFTSPLAFDRQRRRHCGGDETGWRLKELQLESVRIGQHAEGSSGARRKARGLQRARDARAIITFRQRTVVTDRRGASALRPNGDVSDLPVLRQVSQQNEVSNASLKRLLVKLRFEDAHVDFRRGRGIGNQNVEMFESQIFQRERRSCRGLSPCPGANERDACGGANATKK